MPNVKKHELLLESCNKNDRCPICDGIYISWEAWMVSGQYMCVGCWEEVKRVKHRLTWEDNGEV
jgi:hypothetical protein